MARSQAMVFETERLVVRLATVDDANLFYALWTDPRVMVHVGFPHGLRITRAEIVARLSGQGPSEFDQLLVVELKTTGQAIGEAKLSHPDQEGITDPDVKLLPEFWGHKYGVEVWGGLAAYQFTHTDCTAVQGTPNVQNVPSVKMQEAVGAQRLGEAVYHFPESMVDYTAPVHHYIYRLGREDWERSRPLGTASQ